MSKLSQMARKKHREEMRKKYAPVREEIARILKDPGASSASLQVVIPRPSQA